MADTTIAIIGVAFRLPGDMTDESAFWQALQQGQDLVGEIGAERWAVEELQHPKRAEAGRSITFSAGVLSRVDEFDAAFFGISPREAAWLDPQQRLLLELAWEAMENGGHPPSRMAGSDCAVYVGISGFDYGIRGLDDLSTMTAYSMTGNTLSVAANRLSYVFDLHGPSLAVDTACSSSLVALHQACNSLRAGESATALVAGVHLLLHPYPFIGFTKASMLSAGGRCKTFDATGDGYVRAEGGAVLLLKPLAQAIADGDDIRAVIRATGANADGGRKTGMTIPSAEGQAELMQAVMQRAGVKAADVDYIEAHGTGTAVGDPIETAAIGAVYGQHRLAPLPIGSVKTNVGHLEPASGMAGLVKALLMLKHRAIPPSLHCVTPNPHIDFAELNLQVVTTYQPFTKPAHQPLLIGVNSFGFGGANAHVLLEEYRPVAQAAPAIDDVAIPPLFLSARTAPALAAMALQYAERLQSASAAEYYAIAYGAAHHRDWLAQRLALNVTSVAQAVTDLTQFANGNAPSTICLEEQPETAAKIAFVYSGNGAQWAGMGQQLMQDTPRFVQLMEALDAAILPLTGYSIIAELQAEPAQSRLADTAVAQPLLFAMQVAITILMQERGIMPHAVTGHSVGEVAAAWAAGALSLAQAVRVICVRSASQALTQGCGRMAAVSLSVAEMRVLLAEQACPDVDIVGFNSPQNITLAGSLASLQRLQASCDAQNIFFRVLDLDYAFHSAHMDSIKDHLAAGLAGLAPTAAHQAILVSTVTGDVLAGEAFDAHYWWRNVRDPVRFEQAISSLTQQGCNVFVEISPHTILQRYLRECLSARALSAGVLSTLRREDDGRHRLDEAALRIQLLTTGATRQTYFPQPAPRVSLPNYPWQRERYWLPSTSDAYNLLARRRVHPLLGWRLKDADTAWENVIDPILSPWLRDHQVGGAIVLPGAAYVEMALAAAREWQHSSLFDIENLDIVAPIVLDGEHARSTRFELTPRDGSFVIRSRQRLSDDEWMINAVGRVLAATPWSASSGSVHDVMTEVGQIHLNQAQHYQFASQIGLDYGPAFQGLQAVAWAGDSLHGEFALPTACVASSAEMILHPAILDVCFQSLLDFFHEDISAGRGVPLLPVKVGRLRFGSAAPVVAFRTRITRRGMRSVVADFDLLDAAGNVTVMLTDCRFRAAAIQRRDKATPAYWQIHTQLAPHELDQRSLGSIILPDVAELMAQWRLDFSARAAQPQRHAYVTETAPLLNALTLSFAHEAFTQLHHRHTMWWQQACTDAAQLMPAVRPLFSWLQHQLQQAELLHCVDGTWQLTESDLPVPDLIWRSILQDDPASLPELVLIGRIGSHLPALLKGELDAAVFAQQLHDSPPAETLYHDASAYSSIRIATEQALVQVARQWPDNRRLRVLEITHSLSTVACALAAQFDGARLDYVIAQTNPERHARLSAEYRDRPMITVAHWLDDSLQLQADSPLPAQFDIIIVRHSLHRSDKPNAYLAVLQRQLAQGGLLMIAERHPDAHVEFTFGLDSAWWYQAADMAPVSRLMPASVWQDQLVQAGYTQIEVLVESSPEQAAGSYLIVAKQTQTALRAPEPATASWLLLATATASSMQLATALQAQLQAQGQRVLIAVSQHKAAQTICDMATYEADQPASIDTMLSVAIAQLGQINHVVQLSALQSDMQINTQIQVAQPYQPTLNWFHLVQTLVARTTPPRVWLVTAGGALMADKMSCVQPADAAMWGMGRVVMNEYPDLALTMIDIGERDASADIAQRLTHSLLVPDAETEILYTDHARYGLRLQPAAHRPTQDTAATAATRYRLDFRVPGQLRNLTWLPLPERMLADDEVEVQPIATGLNFRDVMYVMGLLPDEAVENGFAGASLGLECAGVVTRIGAQVREFAVGDAVMGFGSACFASHIVTQATALTRKPAAWSFESAATVPTVFFTVYYALKYLANLQPGERVLIHGGAGGVGIAAIQLARHLGAEIYATAGSEEKRDFVRLLGADHVLDSRSLDYADQILALTHGEGVDVVLNSLAGEAIRRNLQVLKPFGRFLELGKRDFFENTPIGLRSFKDNISYFGIDADQLLIARPALAARLFREVMDLFHDGALSPLPYRAYSPRTVVDAFRTMQQARHIGKVVVTMTADAPVVAMVAPTQPALQLAPDSTWLITGGIAGFGLASAKWLAQQGIKYLVLVGRRGMQTPGAGDVIAELAGLGAQATILACDVTDRSAVKQVISHIQANMPPLRGVLHAAMVLDDALMGNLDTARMHAVLAPKMLGAQHLHDLTREIPLDYFILYSSVTTLIGNPGQANYVAANAYLESLASLRLSMGLPATCISWGPIGDAGYLTRNAAVKNSLEARLGAAPLTTDIALAQLAQLMRTQNPPTAVANFDWQALARLLPSANGARFAALRQQAGQGSGAQHDTDDFRLMIVGKTPDEIAEIVRALVIAEVAQILCIAPERIDINKSLHDMGLDSLMGVELALGLEKRCGIQLPAMMLNDSPSVARVSARIVEKISTSSITAPASAADKLDALILAVAAQHGDSLSADDVAATAEAHASIHATPHSVASSSSGTMG